MKNEKRGKIVIKSAHKLTKIYCEPVKNSQGRFISQYVRKVDSAGDIILSKKDQESGEYFVREDEIVELYDGKEFDLDNVEDYRIWDAIKHTGRIAEERTADCEFYIDRPDVSTRIFNDRAKLKNKAYNFIFGDSIEGWVQKTRLLGKNALSSSPDDIQKYLIGLAESNPEKIIDLYTGGDTTKRLLILDALDKKIFIESKGVTSYADEPIGMSETQIVAWIDDPMNAKKVELIRKELYPEYFATTKKAKQQ